MRDSTIIYRSFYEAISGLEKEDQVNVWNAVFEYSLNFKIIDLQGVAAAIFKLIKPQLDANLKRYRSGLTPKEKRKISKPEAKGKRKISKHEANLNPNPNPNLNENENELIFPFVSLEFKNIWNVLLKEKKWKKKSFAALQTSLEKLSHYTEQDAIQMIKNTIAGEWQGIFPIKKSTNGSNTISNPQGYIEAARELVERRKAAADKQKNITANNQ